MPYWKKNYFNINDFYEKNIKKLRHFLSYDNRRTKFLVIDVVETILSKLYLTITEIIMQNLKSIGQF